MSIRTGVVLLSVMVALAFAWLARDILLVAFLGVLIGVVFSFPVNLLARVMPRGVALLLVLLVLFGGVTAAIVFAAPAMSEQLTDLQDTAPKALKSARNWLKQQGEAAQKIQESAGKAIDKAGQAALPALLGVISGLTSIVLVIVLGAFLVSDPETYKKGLRSLIPKDRE